MAMSWRTQRGGEGDRVSSSLDPMSTPGLEVTSDLVRGAPGFAEPAAIADRVEAAPDAGAVDYAVICHVHRHAVDGWLGWCAA
jgi:hypothetical protein